MPSPKRRKGLLLAVAAAAVLGVAGPVVTVVFSLGGITTIATYMDLHGFTAAMRISAVGAVAVLITPFAWWACAKKRDLPGERAAKARLRALRAETRATPSSPTARHRKVA